MSPTAKRNSRRSTSDWVLSRRPSSAWPQHAPEPHEFVDRVRALRGVLACTLIDARSGTLIARDSTRTVGALELAAVGIARALGGAQRGQFEEVLVGTRSSVHWLLPLDQNLIVHVHIARQDGNLGQIRAETQALLDGHPLSSAG